MKKAFESPEMSVEELSHALYEANLKLTRSIEERNEIFANISHDLRSPITAIRSSIEYLQSLKEPSDDDYTAAIELISARSAVLENMINDIFLLTKIDSDAFSMKYSAVPAIPFLEDIFFEYDADPKYSGRNLILDADESITVKISVDIEYFRRVLDNLMGNALKFTSAGDSITLSARLSENGRHLLITVSDSGIGIAPENIGRIFDRTFTATDARTPGSDQGAGLGLSICRSIVEKHGGSISCTSDGIGKGSSFTIKLDTI